ncbi:TPA: hypothetical protein ACGP3S_002066, partial [Streptococcus agalactiae]
YFLSIQIPRRRSGPLPANNLVKSTRRLQIEKYMDSFTDKELSLMESLASGINEARNIED